jgi:shikimate kinase
MTIPGRRTEVTPRHRVISLTGYRGCGKSTIAPLLADRLGWSWMDSDRLIETQAGQTIREIFDREGEPGFRRRESQVLSELLAQDRIILAAGGGAILSEDNRRSMKAAGPVVWLRAAPAVLSNRIVHDARSAGQRPSLTGRAAGEEVADVLAVREPIYRNAASIVVDVDSKTPVEVVAEILQSLPAEMFGGRPCELL